MGQDTSGRIGVSVTLPLTFQNIELIRRLVVLGHDCQCYLHPRGGCRSRCEDEITELSAFEPDEFDLQKVVASTNEEEFETNLTAIGVRLIHFIIEVAEAYARNISRRDLPQIFGEDDQTVEDVIRRFYDAKQTFLRSGVPSDLIKVGYTLIDN